MNYLTYFSFTDRLWLIFNCSQIFLGSQPELLQRALLCYYFIVLWQIQNELVYANYTYSGKSLQFFEDYVNKEALSMLGDINCTSTVTGLQSKLYNNEARDLIKSAVNASDDDEVILCDGTHTSPAEVVLTLFNNRINFPDESEKVLTECINKSLSSPVAGDIIIFVSVCEPAKTLQPWIDSGTEIVKVSKNREGYLDLVDLEKKLTSHMNSRKQLVGFFPAASRLTGIMMDDVATTILLHQYGALAVWDYSMLAPYSEVNMNPKLPGAAKDIIYFNVNKFIGGVQAPGIAVIKQYLLANTNTPYNSLGVIGAIRAGLAIQLKESLGTQSIMAKEEKLCKQILSHIRTIPEIILLGPTGMIPKRLPTICFLVKHPRGAFLHHRFIVAVLNDVFGIQATAESYIGSEIGISQKLSVEYERILMDEENERLRPGYTRISLAYFTSEQEVGFILEALKMVATEAWKLLPQYECDPITNEWRHHSNSLAKERKWLGAIRYTDGRMLFSDRRISGPGSFPQNYQDCLHTARCIFNRARKMAQKASKSEKLMLKLKDNVETLRWYMLPGEAHELLLGNSQNVKNSIPFDPNFISEPPPFQFIHRHNSLSALDVKSLRNRNLPISSLPIPLQRHQSSPNPVNPSNGGKNPECVSPPTVRFSLGGEVTTIGNFGSQRISNLRANEGGDNPSRNRCNSWGSVPALSPQTRISLGLMDQQPNNGGRRRQRVCSCSSQTDLFNTTSSPENASPTPSLQSLSGSVVECTEEIQAYVKEMTEELATEIKSEIREVISKVEDVLESSDSVDMNSLPGHNASMDSGRNDSVSVSDVTEYLREFSIGMASEVKSEIREAYNTVVEESGGSLQKKGSQDEFDESIKLCRIKDLGCDKHDCVDCIKRRSESFPRPNSAHGWHRPTASSPETSTPTCPYTGTISKLVDPINTASHDSGINMCFTEAEEIRVRHSHPATGYRNCSVPSNVGDRNDLRFIEDLRKCIPTTAEVKLTTATSTTDSKHENCAKKVTSGLKKSDNKWHHVPKEVWTPAAEALEDFEMIHDGDRVLVGLSGSTSSLSLLHILNQYSKTRNLNITVAACTLGAADIDPRVLMLYLKDLGVNYIYDQKDSGDIQSNLVTLAQKSKYNVVALGNTLDTLAEEFLVSLLTKGQLDTLEVHPTSNERKMKIIQPLIYVRERFLEDFAVQYSLPTRTSSRPLNASNSILKVQELINPSVYDNIKSAIRPILLSRLANCKNVHDQKSNTT
ncbi:Pyridoxal phosphate-dependent transferase [Sergentomyia squamirostris]